MKGKKCTEVENNNRDFLTARARRHCFTWFNYTDEDVARLRNIDSATCDYITVGFELCPDTLRPHLQGYVEWNKALSGAQALKRLLGRDTLSPCPIRGSITEKCRLANIRYCQKEDTKNPLLAEKFFEVAHKEKVQGKRNDIFHEVYEALENNPDFGALASEYPEIAIKHHAGIDRTIRYLKEKAAREILQEQFNDWIPWIWQSKLITELSRPCTDKRKIIWYFDHEGNKGKSVLCDWLHFNLDAELLENGKTADLANAWQGKPIVLFDLSRSSEERVNYGAIESIKNGRMFSAKYNSTTKWAHQISHVVVFANWPPEMRSLSVDRWDIRQIRKEDCVIDTNDV